MKLLVRIVLNAFAIYVAAYLVDGITLALTAALVAGFEISGFWNALGGALIVTVVSWVLNAAVREPPAAARRAN